ncbi:hypothetical protein MRB53_007369 [Persea americana]|uniref:Uncharacterized protein n=1 Tax=Persea americana TaxID=3435 RepID=A0ACC2MJP4_PERAE|nr:hypothetical protein MRB53_007369 [Persea americana]
MGCEVDTASIQAFEHRPKPSIVDACGTPLIDLSPNSSNCDDPEAISVLITEIGSDFRDWGLFHRRSVMWGAMKCGYCEAEQTKDARDWKEVFDFTVQEPTVIPASHEPHFHKLQTLKN